MYLNLLLDDKKCVLNLYTTKFILTYRPAIGAAASIWEGAQRCHGEIGGVAEEDWGRSGGEGEGTEEGWGGGGEE